MRHRRLRRTAEGAPLLFDGLKKLEYRGYDSAGISVLDGDAYRPGPRGRQPRPSARGDRRREAARYGGVAARQCAGGRGTLAARHRRSGIRAGPRTGASPRRTRTRTTTPTAAFTSPSTGSSRTTSRCGRNCSSAGSVFTSETDAEVIAHLIAKHYDGDLPTRCAAPTASLHGHYAFVAMSADEPGCSSAHARSARWSSDAATASSSSARRCRRSSARPTASST